MTRIGALRQWIVTALLALFPSLALAQGGPIQQSGPMTPGHPAMWITNGVQGDAGPALSGKLKEVGITNTGTPLCINDAPITGPYHQLCLGANALGGGLLSYNAYGGAPQLGLNCVINGVSLPCLPPGGNFTSNPPSGSFWANDTPPGHVARLNDRLFVGGGTWSYDNTSNNCVAPGTACTWISNLRATGGPNYEYLQQFSQMLSYSTRGQEGAFFASRASDNVWPTNCCAIGSADLVVNDQTAKPIQGWGHLITVLRMAGAGSLYGMEMDVANQGDVVHWNPFGGEGPNAHLASFGLDINSGSEAAPSICPTCPPLSPVTAGLVLNNVNAGGQFEKGIMIMAGAVSGTDGITGTGTAIAMAKGHEIVWYASDAQQHASIGSNIGNAFGANVFGLTFEPTGLIFSASYSSIFFDLLAAAQGDQALVRFYSPATNGWSIGMAVDGTFIATDGTTGVTWMSVSLADEILLGTPAHAVATGGVLILGQTPADCSTVPSHTLFSPGDGIVHICP